MDRKWWTLVAVCTGVFMLLLDVTIVNVALPDIQNRFHASLSDLQWVIDAYALTLAAALLTAVCLGVFMLLLDITIVNVALPDIQSQLNASLSDLQWVIDAYALSLAALLLTAGSLADLFGRRRLFVIGLVIFTVGSVACGAAQDIFFLQISRAFQGIGGAAMFATALALLASAFHGKDRGTAFGVFGATTGVAVAIGPVLGGALTSGLSWRWIFFVNIPICLVALAVSALKVVESKDPHAGRPDWLGFISFSLALAALVYGLIEAGKEAGARGASSRR